MRMDPRQQLTYLLTVTFRETYQHSDSLTLLVLKIRHVEDPRCNWNFVWSHRVSYRVLHRGHRYTSLFCTPSSDGRNLTRDRPSLIVIFTIKEMGLTRIKIHRGEVKHNETKQLWFVFTKPYTFCKYQILTLIHWLIHFYLKILSELLLLWDYRNFKTITCKLNLFQWNL